MNKYIERYKEWRDELRVKLAQRYADLIITQLENSKTEMEFNYWYNQGVNLDARMIIMYDVYLD